MERAPYQPNLTNPADTRHFDDDIPNEVSSESHSGIDVIE